MKIKQEKGSVSVMVIVTILFIIIVLTTLYITISNVQTAQIKETKRIKEIYEKDLENLDDIYATLQESKLYIYTKQDIIEFRDRVNSGISYEGKTVYLMNDIDLNEGMYKVNENGAVVFDEGAQKWESIGNSSNSFKGIFDGMNYSILGLYMDDKQFMFENVTEDTAIQNLKIENSNSIQDTQLLGIVKDDFGKIVNCHNDSNLLYELPNIPDDFEYVEGTIYTGVVIKNKVTQDEFVWVPVETPIAENQTQLDNFIKEGKYPMAVKTEGQDLNNRDNYRGVLYEFELNENGDDINIIAKDYNEDTEFKEPYNLQGTITIDDEVYVYDSRGDV